MTLSESIKLLVWEYREYLVPALFGSIMWMWRRARREARFRHRLEAALNELRPNGGSSLRDAVDAISRRLEHLEEGQEAIKQVLTETRAIQTAYMSLATGEHQALFQADANGGCVWVDSTFHHWTGRTMSQLEGMGWIAVITERDRDRVVSQWKMAVANGADFRSEYDIIRYDGIPLPVIGTAIAMHGKSRQLVGYLGFLQQRL